MRGWLASGFGIGLGLMTAIASLAQDRDRSPHGDMDRLCAQCHSPDRWMPISRTTTFDHGETGFALEGAHVKLPCRSCHESLVFDHVATECADCHPDPHQGAMGAQCASCHVVRTWTNQREMFRAHSRTRFPLLGVHASIDCQACHKTTRFVNAPSECFFCHQTEYTRTTSPNHVAAGFPTECQTCHDPSGWRPATFDHDARSFPIYSGPHRGTWQLCAECHLIRTNFHAFECLQCHAHRDRALADRRHVRVPQFQYQSAACYRCHPQGARL